MATPDAPHPQGLLRVWDPFVRLFHWCLVASFIAAWLTPFGRTAALHYWAGYAAAGLVGMRLLWGLLGTPYARFRQFVRRPRVVFAYMKAIARGDADRYVGHNPAGGAMVIALLIGMGLTALTGWMMTTNRYFGISWVQTAHSLAAHGLLVLVVVHLAGIALASRQHGENLVRAMITGMKRRK